LEREIEAITKWLKQSGLKVNDEQKKLAFACLRNTTSILPYWRMMSKFHLIYKICNSEYLICHEQEFGKAMQFNRKGNLYRLHK
jgi:hypothetical protein